VMVVKLKIDPHSPHHVRYNLAGVIQVIKSLRDFI